MDYLEQKITEYIDTIEVMIERSVDVRRRDRIKKLMVDQIVETCKQYVKDNQEK